MLPGAAGGKDAGANPSCPATAEAGGSEVVAGRGEPCAAPDQPSAPSAVQAAAWGRLAPSRDLGLS